MPRKKVGSTIKAQRAVRQRSVRGGKSRTSTGRRRTANQPRVSQKAVPALRWIGRAGGRDYYATVKRRSSSRRK